MYFFKEYVDQYGADKTLGWADELIRYFRMYSSPLIEQTIAQKNMNIILSNIDMEHVLKMFKNPKKLAEVGWKITPMIVMEKIRNILIGERVEAGLTVNVHALDATAESDRDADKKLLKNRSRIESLMSYLNKQIGLRPYTLTNNPKGDKENVFQGNTDMFDALGLNAQSDFEIAYFFQTWHRLLYEMDAQQLINYLLEYNDLKENIDKWVNDILAKKSIGMQVYVNEMTGAFEARYLAPEAISIIPGKRKDGKDAACISYEEKVTVSELLKRMGNNIDLENDWQALLWAVNYFNKTEFTGIFDSIDADRTQYKWSGTYAPDAPVVDTVNRQGCAMSDFLNYKVSVGYIEWKSWNKRTLKTGKNYHGNTSLYLAQGINRNNEEKPNDTKYAKESDYLQVTYRAWYIPTSSFTQYIPRWGKLPYQIIEGSEDEYSNYSILIRKESGPTVAEIANPFIEIIQECFTKKRWMIRKAKPKGRSYNYESMVKIAKHMHGNGDKAVNIQALLQMFEESINEMYVIPTNIRGENVGGGTQPNYDLPNGLDPTALTFKELIDWAISMIKDQLGITPLREAFSPKPNDGLRLQQEAKKASEYSTNYINNMLDGLMKNTGQRFLMSVLDVVYYKNSMAYNFLKGILGDAGISRIKSLDKIALHRYGIFVNGFSSYMERQQVRLDTEEAARNKEITYEVKMLINSIDDYRKAAYILAFEKRRAEKREEQMEQQKQQSLMQLEGLKHQNLMQEINAKGQWDAKGHDITGLWSYRAQIAVMAAKQGIQAEKLQHEAEKYESQVEKEIEIMTAEQNLKLQAPIPAA